MWRESGLFRGVAQEQQSKRPITLRLSAGDFRNKKGGRSPLSKSTAKGGPRGVGSVAFGRDGQGIATPDIDAHQARTVIAARILEEHDDATVGRPCGALGVIARIEQTLARAIGRHDADMELPTGLAGKGDEM